VGAPSSADALALASGVPVGSADWLAEEIWVGSALALGAPPHAARLLARQVPMMKPVTLFRFPTWPCLHACAGQRR
jgi:hypothetical protein